MPGRIPLARVTNPPPYFFLGVKNNLFITKIHMKWDTRRVMGIPKPHMASRTLRKSKFS